MYDFTEGMREISGFGGSYETGCRAMVKAGLEFWDKQPPTFDPQFHGYKGIYGIIETDNDDAKALEKAVLDAPFTDPRTGEQTTVSEYGATGAMHQASIAHILRAHATGWDQYVKDMSTPREEEASK